MTRLVQLGHTIALITWLSFASPISTPAQEGPSGGGHPAADKPAAKKPVTKSTTRKSTPAQQSTGGSVDRIDGKWWTVGNDFGQSQVVFTQNGNNIVGAITYSDGRTGQLTGTLINKKLTYTWSNSTDEAGSGWLELSWTNFLGGTWRGRQVRDGSWAMRRIEGNWCFSGSRTRIRKVTHDAAGHLSLVTEDGTQEEGRLEGPYLFLTGDFGELKGDINYKGTRVDFANGMFWTWCGR